MAVLGTHAVVGLLYAAGEGMFSLGSAFPVVHPAMVDPLALDMITAVRYVKKALKETEGDDVDPRAMPSLVQLLSRYDGRKLLWARRDHLDEHHLRERGLLVWSRAVAMVRLLTRLGMMDQRMSEIVFDDMGDINIWRVLYNAVMPLALMLSSCLGLSRRMAALPHMAASTSGPAQPTRPAYYRLALMVMVAPLPEQIQRRYFQFSLILQLPSLIDAIEAYPRLAELPFLLVQQATRHLIGPFSGGAMTYEDEMKYLVEGTVDNYGRRIVVYSLINTSCLLTCPSPAGGRRKQWLAQVHQQLARARVDLEHRAELARHIRAVFYHDTTRAGKRARPPVDTANAAKRPRTGEQ